MMVICSKYKLFFSFILAPGKQKTFNYDSPMLTNNGNVLD